MSEGKSIFSEYMNIKPMPAGPESQAVIKSVVQCPRHGEIDVPPGTVNCPICNRCVSVGPGPQLSTEPLAGLHLDEGKSQVDGIDPLFIVAVGDVLAYGARKYARLNWTKGIHVSRIYASCMRHLLAYYGGEDIDPESGKPHLHHLACDVMFLVSYAARPEKYAEFDDRVFKKEVDDA